MTPAIRRKIVFDIDDVLCTCLVNNIGEVAFYAQHGLIITAFKTHYVFPGVVELMKASFDEPDTDIYFSSRGEEARNKKFTSKLLKRSLGKERASKVVYGVHTVKRKVYFGDPPESKNLEEICGDKKYSCIVDDSKANIHPGQFKNFVYVYQPRFNDFRPFCNVDGYVDETMERHGSSSYYYMAVYGGIHVSTKSIIFLDKKTFEKTAVPLCKTEHAELISNIKKAKSEEALEASRSQIVQIIEKAGGLARRVDQKANHLFNYTGVLFTALNENKKTGEPIGDILYRLQWRRNIDGHNCSPEEEIFWSIFNDRFYEYGLEVLRKYNPSLSFMSRQKYVAASQIVLTPEMKALYQSYLDNNV